MPLNPSVSASEQPKATLAKCSTDPKTGPLARTRLAQEPPTARRARSRSCPSPRVGDGASRGAVLGRGRAVRIEVGAAAIPGAGCGCSRRSAGSAPTRRCGRTGRVMLI